MRIGLSALVPLFLVLSAAAQILTVPNGGTGQGTLPAHGPLVGNGAAPVNSIPPGAAGQCLISGGPNVDPVFAPCPGGATGGGTPGGILGYPQSYGTGAVFAGNLTELIVDNFSGATIDAKIAAAQAALPANGGILTLSCTNYPVTNGSIALSKSNVTLRGCGASSIASNTGATTLNFPAATAGIIVTGANVSIEKLSLVSASSVLGTDDGIQLNNSGPKVKNVSIARFGRHGIRFVDQTDLWMLEDIISQGNFGDGIRLDTPCTDNSIGVSTRVTVRSNGGWGLNVLCGWSNTFMDTQSDNNALGAGHTSAGYNTYKVFYTEATGLPNTLFQFDAQAQYNRIWVNAFGQPTIQDNAPQGSNEIFYTAATGEGNYPAQTVFRISTKPNAATPFAVTLIAGASLTTPDLLWRDNTNGVNLLDYAPSTGWKFLRPVMIGNPNSVAGSLLIASGSTIYSTTITTQATTQNTAFNLPPDNGANGSCLITNGAGNTSWSSSCGGGGGSMTYPGAGIANSTGTSGPWGTSYSGTNQIPANFVSQSLTSSTTGNAATATALQTTPQQCTTAGQFATGIQANGNANCSTPSGGPGPGVTIPGAVGDVLLSTGNNAMQADTGNLYYDVANKVLYTPAIHVNATSDGYASYVAGTGNLPALPANSMGFSAPPTGGTSGLIRLPGTLTAGAFTLTAPATTNGVNQSQAGVTPIATAATPNALVQTNASGTIDPSFVTGGTGGGGNVSSGTGVAQYLIPVWQSSTTIGGIASGSSGQVLTSNGAGAYPSWQPASGGPSGGTQPTFPVTSFNTSVTHPVSTGEFAACQTFAVSAGGPTIQLPQTTPANGQCIWVINYGVGAPSITRLGTQTINGSASNIVVQAGTATNPIGWKIISDGTNFVAQKIPGGTFSTLSSGTALNSAFTIGTGSSVTPSGTGTVNANQLLGAALPGLPASPGGYLQYTGSAFAWGNPSGTGGPTAFSAIQPAIAANSINNLAFPQVWNWDLGSTANTGFRINEAPAGTGSGILMEVSTYPNSTTDPLAVYAGSNGWFRFAANGQLEARTGAEFVGPMVLTTVGNPGTPIVNAAALGTDQNGNIYPVTPGGGAGVGTYYNSSEHGALGTVGIGVSTVANAVAAVHFYYGKPYAVSFSTIYISVSTGDITNNSGMAIWDVTANPPNGSMLCHSVPRTAAAGVQAFNCAEGTVQLLPMHDYIFLRASGGTTLSATGNAISQIPSQYTSTNTPNCTFGSNGITCNANFSLVTYSNAGNSINFFLR